MRMPDHLDLPTGGAPDSLKQRRKRRVTHVNSPRDNRRVGSARGAAQVKAPVNQSGQAEMLGQGGRQDQPSIVHQAVVVKGDLDVVGMVAWEHLLGALGLGSVLCLGNHYPRCTGALFAPSAHRDTHLFGGLGFRTWNHGTKEIDPQPQGLRFWPAGACRLSAVHFGDCSHGQHRGLRR